MTDYEVAPPPKRISPHIQIRTAFSTHRGRVTRFMVQLEYWHDETWNEVVRYDHDEDAPGGHDVAAEGLHRDVYRNGEKAVVEDVTGPIDANEGYSIAEDDLTEDLEYYTQRYERWHNLTPPTNQSPTNSTT